MSAFKRGMRLAAVVMLAMGGSALAHGPGMWGNAQMTREQRNKMADAHEKFASCLRSDRSMDQCHQEMEQSCRAIMGPQSCPMMGMHHGAPVQPTPGK